MNNTTGFNSTQIPMFLKFDTVIEKLNSLTIAEVYEYCKIIDDSCDSEKFILDLLEQPFDSKLKVP